MVSGGDWSKSAVYQPAGTVPFEAFDETHPDHAEFVTRAGRCFADHDHDAWLRARHVHVNCWCWACDDLLARAWWLNGGSLPMWTVVFVACPDCGNKRCPKASDHVLACSGSNSSGQPGSVYQ